MHINHKFYKRIYKYMCKNMYVTVSNSRLWLSYFELTILWELEMSCVPTFIKMNISDLTGRWQWGEHPTDSLINTLLFEHLRLLIGWEESDASINGSWRWQIHETPAPVRNLSHWRPSVKTELQLQHSDQQEPASVMETYMDMSFQSSIKTQHVQHAR